jgi:hypothetical protein
MPLQGFLRGAAHLRRKGGLNHGVKEDLAEGLPKARGRSRVARVWRGPRA